MSSSPANSQTSSNAEMVDVAAPAPALPKQGRGRPCQYFCCTQKGRSPDMLVCQGRSHVTLRRFHRSCVGDEDDSDSDNGSNHPWLCAQCREQDAQRPRPSQSQSQSDVESQPSQAQSATQGEEQQNADDGEEGWEIVCIIAERLALPAGDDEADSQPNAQDDNVKEYFVHWAPANGREQICTWESASNVESGEVYQQWLKGEFPSDLNPEIHALAAQAMGEPTDFSDEHAAANNPYWNALGEGYGYLLRKLWDDVQKHPAQKDVSRFDSFAMDGYGILASTPNDILHAVCGAGLVRAKLLNQELYATLEEFRHLSYKQPCIYTIELVNQVGKTLTVSETQKVVACARRYIHPRDPVQDYDGWAADSQLALEIDEAVKSLSDAEKAARLQPIPLRSYVDTDSQKTKITKFCDAVERELKKLTDAGYGPDDRLPFCFRDTGFTDDGIARLTQHESHNQSNRIMMLVEATCISQLEGKYFMHGEIIFLCYHETHASLGEIIFSLLSQSYTETGRGFNGHTAGSNLRSMRNYTSVHLWSDWTANAWNASPLVANLDADDAKTEKRQQLQNKIEERKRAILSTKLAQKRENLRLRKQIIEKVSHLSLSNGEE